MRPIKITLVAGARPNFMKIAPLIRAFKKHDDRVKYRLVDTGQHTDPGMNRVFFEELGIPEPDVSLNCGGNSQAEVTARVMVEMERELQEHPADGVLVVGDVNSTLAAAIVAKKMQTTLIHVEAGLRSGDRSMPEEINRLATDAISDILFVTEPSGEQALIQEGHPAEQLHFVGNVMIDNLFYQIDRLHAEPGNSGRSAAVRRTLGSNTRYGVVTMHRPANVDDPENLRGIVATLRMLAEDLPLVFPIHPRTRTRLDAHNIDLGPNIHTTPPLSYMEFLSLWKDAEIILTDSGGLQEEASAIGVRCVTMRDNTERPVTITDGTNILAGTNPARILEVARQALRFPPSSKRPRLWDGRAAERILDIIIASPLFAR
ncbi:MAG: UDP-N-acetylglucosamine 2-epimerase (non-hydrolyzing) [Lautropia sp.]|nr:UDP-N-acetylglucosamine 2-epimerase (non-hydrolyzing) [Lautropia sp.]